MPSLADDLTLALDLAAAADAISLPRFGASDLRVEAKPDMTPVSDADLAVERRLRELLAEHRPQDAIVGEEFGDGGTAGRSWVIDPIDGTKNYVRGVPVWATLIALLDGGRPVLGVVSAPALARRWWAAEGTGSFVSFAGGEPRRNRVSAVTQLSDASVSYSDRSEWSLSGRLAEFDGLLDSVWRTRAYGDFWSYLMVAEGSVDIAVEPELNLWDLAALAPIVTEAGGTFTDSHGRDIGDNSVSALADNGLLHTAVVGLLGGV